MAIIIRTSTPTDNGAGALTVQGNIPSGSQPGEVAFACVRIRGGSAASVSLTGWTPVTGANHASSSSLRQTVLARLLDGTEGSSVLFNLDSSRIAACSVTVLGQANTSNGNFGINGSPVGQVNSSVNTMTTGTGPSATATNCELLYFGGVAGSVSNITPPGGMTERAERLTGNISLHDASELRAAAGGTGARSTTLSQAITNIAQMFLVEPLLPPSAASGLTSTAVNATTVQLAWTDNSATETGFRAERSINSGASWSTVATLGANVTSAQVAQDPASTAQYRVISFNSQGDGAASNTSTVTTPAIVPGVSVPGIIVPDYVMPQVLYKIILRTPGGVKVAEFLDFLDLKYVKRVNEPGVAGVVLNGNHRVLSMLQDKMLIEVWRRVVGYTNWYIDFKGLLRDEEYETDESGIERATLLFPGAMHRLHWRQVNYPASTNLKTMFIGLQAESIMKYIVDSNLGPGATTANGRKRTGTLGGNHGTVGSTSTLGRGNVTDWYCAEQNVLKTLQKLAVKAGGDFDLVQVGTTNAWFFEFYPGQRGVNRTATVKFSMDRGNMVKPRVTIKRSEEYTAAIIGGPGEDADRIIEFETSKNYNATHNNIEGWVEATQDKTPSARSAKAIAALDKAQSRRVLDFQIAQTLGTMYGVHYCVDGVIGDLLSATHRGITEVHKVVGVEIRVPESGKQDLKIITATL